MPLTDAIAETIRRGNLVAASVLSGNRNFEGRIHPLCRANYLASPMLVVEYALAGDVDFDPYAEPLGNDRNGKPVFLREIWPSPGEITEAVRSAVDPEMFRKEYGSGSSRDWAAKEPQLLGVRAVIAESFERIHRSNLVGMGILPLQYVDGATRKSLGLTGTEIFAGEGIAGEIAPRMRVTVRVSGEGGERTFPALARIDTPAEVQYYRHGGILPYVLRRLIGKG